MTHSPTDTVPSRTTKWDHGLRRKALVAKILAEIFNGTLAAGQRLVAQDLAERYGVSQTPIREALIALAALGTIDLLPNRGAIVRRVGKCEVREVCQVRRVLECEAVRMACGMMTAESLDAIGIAIRQIRSHCHTASEELVRIALVVDSRLHDEIAAACGNELLAREIGRLKLLFRAFRDGSWERVATRNDYSRLIIEADEHLRIIDALKANDPVSAVDAMAQHIESGERYWIGVTYDRTAVTETSSPEKRDTR